MKHRILVADDEPDVRELLSFLISRDGSFELDMASTAEEVWGLVDENDYDLVILDLSFPGERMTGVSLMDRVRERRPLLPIATLTAYAGPQARDAARRAGAIYLTKPIDPFTLIDEIRKLVDEKPLFDHRLERRCRSDNPTLHRRRKTDYAADGIRAVVSGAGI